MCKIVSYSSVELSRSVASEDRDTPSKPYFSIASPLSPPLLCEPDEEDDEDYELFDSNTSKKIRIVRPPRDPNQPRKKPGKKPSACEYHRRNHQRCSCPASNS